MTPFILISLGTFAFGLWLGLRINWAPGSGDAYATVERGPHAGTVIRIGRATFLSIDFMHEGLRVTVPIEDVRLSAHPTVEVPRND